MNLPKGYQPVTLDLYERYAGCIACCPRPSADMTFTNLWGWADRYGLGLSFRDGVCWICQTVPELRYWCPAGDWEAHDWSADPEIRSGLVLNRVPYEAAEAIARRLPGRVSSEDDRDEWEYLYSRQELVELPGSKFHKKKNHVSGFRRRCGEDYRIVGKDCPLDDLLELQNDWCRWRACVDSPSLMAENAAVFRVLGNWSRLPGLEGGALYVDGRIAAFAVGERVGNMTVVHFEKAQSSVKGAYQAINQAFANYSAAGSELINREQDMGEEGLRQAKETYNPVGFLKKCRLVIAGNEA